jgi:hypothetical protein
MNQLDVQIDTYQTFYTYTFQGFVDLLNSAKKLDGSPVFSSINHPYPYQINRIPPLSDLHAFVSNYRASLRVELQKYL